MVKSYQQMDLKKHSAEKKTFHKMHINCLKIFKSENDKASTILTSDLLGNLFFWNVWEAFIFTFIKGKFSFSQHFYNHLNLFLFFWKRALTIFCYWMNFRLVWICFFIFESCFCFNLRSICEFVFRFWILMILGFEALWARLCFAYFFGVFLLFNMLKDFTYLW